MERRKGETNGVGVELMRGGANEGWKNLITHFKADTNPSKNPTFAYL